MAKNVANGTDDVRRGRTVDAPASFSAAPVAMTALPLGSEDEAVHLAKLSLDRSGDGDRNHEADVLGPLLTLFRSDSARTGRGQLYTPACIATLMAAMVTPEEHSSCCEPTTGTGGMLRAAAQAMRHNGRDP
ncbi:N-6 DNA methylase [Allokutzneria sp. A3M-2-11 16]|uniref:N-6 DNA methylase n=1 Tax=Allokutzneria sp. A3M-2-11 16 TaxID=2962043 RepID=UPI0020B6FBFC|nr:N-6 DNA methylase [Allokutzneria sp. A3M-2-11 16]MCP3801984.1 N-6 DNA methylase [Allokutzneria sp. A3M-2-11 16]